MPAASEISLWIVEMPTLSGLPVRLSQMPERKMRRKKTPATITRTDAFMSTPLTL